MSGVGSPVAEPWIFGLANLRLVRENLRGRVLGIAELDRIPVQATFQVASRHQAVCQRH